jgi:hypothetical protein
MQGRMFAGVTWKYQQVYFLLNEHPTLPTLHGFLYNAPRKMETTEWENSVE